ncbi:MAG: HD domain-containing protein [Verrucomicrobiota bacterium]
MTLEELLKEAGENEVDASVHVQLVHAKQSNTQTGKPYFDLEIADANASAKLKIWSETPAFSLCERLKGQEFIELEGYFFRNQYGLNISRPQARLLGDDEIQFLLAGTEESQAATERDWEYLIQLFGQLDDQRLKVITLQCLGEYEAKWKRAAAARSYHHARRGGLLEHTSSMLRAAEAVAPLYPEVSPELLYCGVLFHDVGKLWENDYPERGFASQPALFGEMLGHITIGIEIVNKLWNVAREQNPELFSSEVKPPSEVLREHLLHLIASHHGEMAFGSPVTPRTPEAWLLHHIDNMDAKIEMLRCAYREKEEVVPGLYENRRPLAGMPAKPLSEY